MHRTVRHFAQRDERLKPAKVIIFNAVCLVSNGPPFSAARRHVFMCSPPFFCSPPVRIYVQPAVLCNPPARIYVQPAVFLQPAGPPCCAACRYVFMCSPPARPIVQPALLCSPPARFVQPSGALCCAARPLVQPVDSLCCAGRPNVQLAGPPCFGLPFSAARRPTENSCFSIGNTALQPARPAGPPFSVILSWKYQSVPILIQQTNTVYDHDLNEKMAALEDDLRQNLVDQFHLCINL